MKKIILISFLIVTFTLVGCNHNTAEPPKSDPNPEKTVDKPEEKPEDKQNEDPADKPTEDPVETNDFTLEVPKSKGTDVFAGKTLMQDEYLKYIFSDDGTVIEYSQTYEVDKESGKLIAIDTKQTKFAYSYNSEDKTLILIPRGFYYKDELFTNVDKFLETWTNPGDGNTFSKEYVELYRVIDNLYTKHKSVYFYEEDEDTITLKSKLEDNLENITGSFGGSLFDSWEKKFVSEDGTKTVKNSFHFVWFDFTSGGGSGQFSADKSFKNNKVIFNFRYTDITDSTAVVTYTFAEPNNTTNGGNSTSNNYVIGKAKLTYKITKESDTEGKIKLSITDFDEDFTKFLKDYYSGEGSISEYLGRDFSLDKMELLKDIELPYTTGTGTKYTTK